MKKNNLALHIIIILLLAAELVSRWNNYHLLEYLVKPCLMLWVAGYFYLNTSHSRRSVFIYLAFLFSLIGDIFLMIAGSDNKLFYAGVGGFFLAQIPVIIFYAISLISMSMSAANRKGLTNEESFLLVFSGSVLFVLSDSMIALNKFFTEIPKASFLIMLTYFPAQYLIMLGLIKEDHPKS